MQFQGFKPEAMQRIAGTLGYNGDMSKFDGYLEANPEAKQKMDMYSQQAVNMMNGGVATKNLANGGYMDRLQGSRQQYKAGLTNSAGERIYQGEEAYRGRSDRGRSAPPQIAARQQFFPTSCPSPDTLIDLLDGNKKQAGKLQVGDMLRTQHEDTLEWGDYPVSHVSIVPNSERLKLVFNDSEIICSLSHKFYVDGKGWTTAEDIELNDTVSDKELVSKETSNIGDVVRITVEDAHTYVAAGLISHNKLPPLVDQTVYPPNITGGPSNPSAEDRTRPMPVDESGRYQTDPSIGTLARSLIMDGTGTQQTTTDPRAAIPDTAPQIKKDTIDRMIKPALPTGANVTATGTVVQGSQLIGTGAGQVRGELPTATAADSTTATAADPSAITTSTIDPSLSSGRIEGALDKTTAVEGTVSDGATVGAEQTTESSVSDLTTTEGMSIDVKEVADRKMEIGERVDPVANAASAATFTEEIQAATATPTEKATVKGQLAELMTDFEGKPKSGLYRDDRGQIVDESGRPVSVQRDRDNPNAYDNLPSLSEAKAEAGTTTPAWAAGSMRAATAAMAARGLGASSMAGQALIQAAMESALPIASADAGTFAKFESQNLSNRQQRSMLAAEQRAAFMGQEFDQKFQARVVNATKVSDIADMNFTADQQVALENSRAANTVNLSNMSNTQALLMGEVAALANLDMANLSNRQQAAVTNAQAFLATDMANLSNRQQVEMFKAQSRTQSLFTDTAAENASKQFNATSENQTNQFFANLKTQTSQFNTSQKNAMNQFNAGEENSLSKFNAEIENQRDQFNATNSLVIAQSNATWRREVATAGTAAVNRANEINAQNILGISNQAHANLWQEHGDLMEWAWKSSDNERDRQKDITLSHLAAGKDRTQAQAAADLAASNAMGDFVGKLILGSIGKIFSW